MSEISVVIVGAGQRGLSTLERISALYPEIGDPLKLRIHVVDPGLAGQGTHRGGQAEHLITNTTIAQTTVFVDHSVRGAGPAAIGPSYADWLWLAGYRWDGRIVRHGDEPVPDDTYTPRSLLGEYLHWCFNHIRQNVPQGIEVEHHEAEAVGIKRVGDRFVVRLRREISIVADFVFVTTGHHSSRTSIEDTELLSRVANLRRVNPNIDYVPSSHEFDRLPAIPSASRVLICGTGLTAADAVSTLTLGRGGRFDSAGPRRLRYTASGDEPRISLYSRQGLPASSKGVNQKTIGRNYQPLVFTMEYVDSQRRAKGRLDWERDLLPTLMSEIERCYAATVTRETGGNTSISKEDLRKLVLKMLDPWEGAVVTSREQHCDFIYEHLSDDIDAAFRGNRRDPTKAVSEMLRDLNDVVRHAVDYGGLTQESHRKFLREWVSVNNRVAAGPPKERNMELLALIDAGIIDFFEPNPSVGLDQDEACYRASASLPGYQREEAFDVLIKARVPAFDIETAGNSFFEDGRANGLFVPFLNGSYRPGGIAIDRNLNVIDASGDTIANMWAMGYVVEGAHYYTYVLPCPFSNSRSLRDAAHAARTMLKSAALRAEVRTSAVGGR